VALQGKGEFPVTELLKLIGTLLDALPETCNGCLIDVLNDEVAGLADVIEDLEAAYLLRDISPAAEDNYTVALARYLAKTARISLFVTALSARPGVRWTDEATEIAIPIINIPN